MADLLREYKRQQIEWQLKLSAEFPLEYVRREAAFQYDFFFAVWRFLGLSCESGASFLKPLPVQKST